MEDINMHQIEMFLAVAKYQNMSKAAQELYTSQPAVSNVIAKMEEHCGFRLFNRTNRGVELTLKGEELYSRLDVAYHRFRISVEEICKSNTEDSATLRIGVLNRYDAMNVAEEQIHAFSLQFPDVPVVGERFNFHELRDKILCEELDVIFSLSADINPYPEFDSIPICDFPAFFLVPKSLEKTLARKPGLSALSGKTMIIEVPTQRSWAENICADYGIVPSDVRYVNSYILASALVSHGQGFSIDGKMITEGIYVPATASLPVTKAHSLKIVMAWKKEKRSPNAGKYIEFISGARFGEK